MKHWWHEMLAFLGERLRAEDGRERVLLGGPSAFTGGPSTRTEEPRMPDAGEFADLLESLGAVDGPAELEAQVLFKELEIAELQRNLKDLRGMGDALADIEQERLAERDELVGQRARAREEAALWKAHAEELQRRLDEVDSSVAGLAERGAARAEEDGALVRRYQTLRERHARLTARWRGLPRGERSAADQLLALRSELVEARRENGRLEARGERLERELERRDAQRDRDRERLAQARARTEAARAKAREHRERSLARAAELREFREGLRARDGRLEALEGLCAALRAEIEGWERNAADAPAGGAPSPASLDGMRRRLERLLEGRA